MSDTVYTTVKTEGGMYFTVHEIFDDHNEPTGRYRQVRHRPTKDGVEVLSLRTSYSRKLLCDKADESIAQAAQTEQRLKRIIARRAVSA